MPGRKLQVLVVDDIVQFASAMSMDLAAARDILGQDCRVTAATNLDAVRDLLDDDDIEPFDVALVDLGLGFGAPSGLAVIKEIAEQSPETRIALHPDLSENASRLMFVHAAFHWFGEHVHALLPKAGNGGPLPQYYGDAVARLRDGRRLDPDLSKPFRAPAHGGRDPFRLLLNSHADLQNLRLFARYTSFPAMAAAGHKEAGVLRDWASDHLPYVSELIEAAAGTAVTVDQEVQLIDSGVDGAGPKRNAPLPTLTAFARSQSWFLNDPAVEEVLARPRR